ncbi:MAG: aspartate ammonia-lyase [Bacteroidia bacterium]|nr:aspartate ammonia-lyase [Bacteroidia bacterium]
MDTKQIFDFIREIELFNGLNDQELAVTAGKIMEADYEPQKHLFEESTARKEIFIIFSGKVELYKKTPHGDEKRLCLFSKYDFLGEGALTEDSPHSTNARVLEKTVALVIGRDFFNSHATISLKVFSNIARVITRRMRQANNKSVSSAFQYESGRTRTEHDLLGNREVPYEHYYGVQTLRAVENFNISGVTMNFYPLLIDAFAIVKMAAAHANYELGLLPKEIHDVIIGACQDILDGKFHNHFVVDMVQGGAGTSMNMNANEVIANRALELLGHDRGEYKFCHPNNHVNMSQSTNDAYPTAVKLAIYNSNKKLIGHLEDLIASFRKKSDEFAHIIKMGRTQLQDAVPMTMGQTFGVFADTLESEVARLNENAKLFLEANMGATAIGTGINAEPEYSAIVIKHLRKITGDDIILAKNLVEATSETGSYVIYSGAVKRLAVKLSKICNDLRLLASGPRAGLNEIQLPPMQPGSSIMPGKVNPVIPEVVNQIAFKVIGNDLTVTLAAEAGQLELNVMEPMIVQSLFESIEFLKNGMDTLRIRCIEGIKANDKKCRWFVEQSIGLVTALNPYIGYENSSMIAKEALEKEKSVYELVLEKKLLSKEQLDQILAPENMIKPHKLLKFDTH